MRRLHGKMTPKCLSYMGFVSWVILCGGIVLVPLLLHTSTAHITKVCLGSAASIALILAGGYIIISSRLWTGGCSSHLHEPVAAEEGRLTPSASVIFLPQRHLDRAQHKTVSKATESSAASTTTHQLCRVDQFNKIGRFRVRVISESELCRDGVCLHKNKDRCCQDVKRLGGPSSGRAVRSADGDEPAPIIIGRFTVRVISENVL